MRCATFNVLADAYVERGNYSHVGPGLLLPHARTQEIVRLINSLQADIIGLQEVEVSLLHVLRRTGNWQAFWSPKTHANQPDGCLTLVQPDIEVHEFDTFPFSDGSGNTMQTLKIDGATFVNAHIKWAPEGSSKHAGVLQTTELLARIKDEETVIIVGDCNDKPGGPVRQLIEAAGFRNVCKENEPTALVEQEPVALDLLAVRGLSAQCVAITRDYAITDIPNRQCPSDHIPIVAEIEL